MANQAFPSGAGPSPWAWRAATASAVTLLVVGAGAAIGMNQDGPAARPAAAPAGSVPAAGAGNGGTAGARVGPGPTTTSVPATADRATTTVAGPGPAYGDGGSATSTTVAAATAPAGGEASAGPTSTPTVTGTTVTTTTTTVTTTGAGAGPVTPGPTSTVATPATTAPAGSPGRSLPVPGAYTYDTSGTHQESFSGSSAYPSRTTIVVARSGCGESLTWHSSPGNSQSMVECPVPGGVRVVSETLTISSSGTSTTEVFNCDSDSFIPVGSGRPGQTWSWSCHTSNGGTADQVVDLVGPSTVTVGGAPVDVEQVTVQSTLSGQMQGTTDTAYWLTGDATPAKEEIKSNLSSGLFSYRSQCSLQLESLTPAS